MKKIKIYNNANTIIAALKVFDPMFVDGTVSVLLENGVTVSITGANRPYSGKMTVSVLRGAKNEECIDYLFDADETARIAKTLCEKYTEEHKLLESLIFTRGEPEWHDFVTVTVAPEPELENIVIIVDDVPDDELAA